MSVCKYPPQIEYAAEYLIPATTQFHLIALDSQKQLSDQNDHRASFELKFGRVVCHRSSDSTGTDVIYEYFAVLATKIDSNTESPTPGDDVTLTFKLKNVVGTMSDASALRVYDKKLLWRANLYIAEEGKDWNDLHPWIGDANNPNEWNRIYDGTQSSTFSQLTVGTGGQVVKYLDFTPLRSIPLGTEGAPTGENVLKNTVAYSYPDHPTEGPSNSKGDAGSMDSPFDFVWKIKQQQNALFWNYDNVGNTKSPPTASSPGWLKTTAPSNKWAKYKSGAGADTFIPSLGLYYTVRNPTSPFYQKWTNDEENLLGIAEYNLPQTFEAGTDCVGLAQRSASYTGSGYKWSKLPKGLFEGGFNNYSASWSQYNDEHFRQYVRGTDGTGKDIVNHNAGSVFSETEIEQLKKIVPGDIWVKYSNATTDQQTVNGVNGPTHIAIVASVPVFVDGMTAKQFIDQTLLIEGEFSAKIQSVIKKLSVGMYDDSAVPRNTVIYPGFDAPDGVSLNCTSWAIRRLLN